MYRNTHSMLWYSYDAGAHISWSTLNIEQFSKKRIIAYNVARIKYGDWCILVQVSFSGAQHPKNINHYLFNFSYFFIS